MVDSFLIIHSYNSLPLKRTRLIFNPKKIVKNYPRIVEVHLKTGSFKFQAAIIKYQSYTFPKPKISDSSFTPTVQPSRSHRDQFDVSLILYIMT